MNRSGQLLSITAIVVACMSGALALTSVAQEQEPAKGPYRTMFRHEIDELGGHEKGKLLPVNSTDSLQAGLNTLHADGWELVAVESSRRIKLGLPGDATAVYAPVYIFRRIEQ